MNEISSQSKPKLVLLSDLWGLKNAAWVNEYVFRLEDKFEITQYDCCTLGSINLDLYKETILHQQFVHGGIDAAVQKLLLLEKEPVNILAFSIGGSIAWKAGLLGLKIRNFYAISSTRLRYEEEKIEANIQLFFGENDPYKPSLDWYPKLSLDAQIIANKNHTLYKEKAMIQLVCNQLMQSI